MNVTVAGKDIDISDQEVDALRSVSERKEPYVVLGHGFPTLAAQDAWARQQKGFSSPTRLVRLGLVKKGLVEHKVLAVRAVGLEQEVNWQKERFTLTPAGKSALRMLRAHKN